MTKQRLTEQEIEVTPEMIEAGAKAACLFDPASDAFDVMLPTIFLEMFQAMDLHDLRRPSS